MSRFLRPNKSYSIGKVLTTGSCRRLSVNTFIFWKVTIDCPKRSCKSISQRIKTSSWSTSGKSERTINSRGQRVNSLAAAHSTLGSICHHQIQATQRLKIEWNEDLCPRIRRSRLVFKSFSKRFRKWEIRDSGVASPADIAPLKSIGCERCEAAKGKGAWQWEESHAKDYCLIGAARIFLDLDTAYWIIKNRTASFPLIIVHEIVFKSLSSRNSASESAISYTCPGKTHSKGATRYIRLCLPIDIKSQSWPKKWLCVWLLLLIIILLVVSCQK